MHICCVLLCCSAFRALRVSSFVWRIEFADATHNYNSHTHNLFAQSKYSSSSSTRLGTSAPRQQ